MRNVHYSFSLALFIFAFSSFFSLLVYYDLIAEYGTPYYLGGSDDLIYESEAKQFIGKFGFYDKEQVLQLLGNPFHNSPGFVWFLTKYIEFIQVFTHYDTLYFRLFNCLLYSITSIFFYRFVCNLDLFTNKQSFLISLSSFSIPFSLYINSFVFRDTLILFFIVTYLYFVDKTYRDLCRGLSLNKVCVSIFFISSIIIIMLPLRELYSLVFLVVLIMTILNALYARSSFKKLYLVISIILAICLVSYLLIKYGDYFSKLINLILGYNEYVGHKASGLTSFIFNQPFPISGMTRIIFSIFYPLPEIGGGYKFFLLIGTMLQIISFPLIGIGVFISRKINGMFPTFLLFIFLYLGVVWGTYTFRHFYYILFFYPLFFVIGFKKIVNYGLHRYLSHYIALVLMVFSVLLSFFISRLF